MHYFGNAFTNFWEKFWRNGVNVGTETSQISLKYLHLCFKGKLTTK